MSSNTPPIASVSATASETLVFQPPHSLSEQEHRFLRSLPTNETKLHTLASEMLGSSYFVGKTHAFTTWKNKQVSQDTQPPATK